MEIPVILQLSDLEVEAISTLAHRGDGKWEAYFLILRLKLNLTSTLTLEREEGFLLYELDLFQKWKRSEAASRKTCLIGNKSRDQDWSRCWVWAGSVSTKSLQ